MNLAKPCQPLLPSIALMFAAICTLSAACGGGGDGSALPVAAATTSAAITPAATTPTVDPNTPVVAPVTPTAPAADVANPSTITTTVVAPTYPSASEQATAFSLLNAERVACGFGAVAQSTQQDAAAAGHAKYLLADNFGDQYQHAGTPNFTGNSPLDRATAAGYTAMSIADLNTSVKLAPCRGRVPVCAVDLREPGAHLELSQSSITPFIS